jgi:hypothetical protein
MRNDKNLNTSAPTLVLAAKMITCRTLGAKFPYAGATSNADNEITCQGKSHTILIITLKITHRSRHMVNTTELRLYDPTHLHKRVKDDRDAAD